MKRIIGRFIIVVLCTQVACSKEAQTDSPLIPARGLLKLHHLLGKRPADRTEGEKNQKVSRDALVPFVADLDNRDPFLTDLYVGFVVGVLAQSQDNLRVSTQADRGTISAGGLPIRVIREKGIWKINLEETVPKEVKARAREEKAKVQSRIEPQRTR